MVLKMDYNGDVYLVDYKKLNGAALILGVSRYSSVDNKWIGIGKTYFKDNKLKRAIYAKVEALP